MKARKKRRSKTTKRHWISGSRVLPRSILVIAIIVLVIIVILHQFRPAVETPVTEVRKIPEDVKKSLSETKIPNSLSIQIRVPILLYHYVEYVKDSKDNIRQSLNIQPSTFELQLLTLKNAGYTFITARELGEVIEGRRALSEKPVLLTFDDGHWDFNTIVLPLLKKYQIKATLYVITGFIGGSDFMSDKQVQEVVDSGLVDVGAHTVNHIPLSGKLFPVVKYEIESSKNFLEKRYKLDVVSFAYPNGAFDNNSVNIVKEAGYTTSMSTIPGVEQSDQNRFFLYRLRPGYRTGDELLRYLEGNIFKPY